VCVVWTTELPVVSRAVRGYWTLGTLLAASLQSCVTIVALPQAGNFFR